MAEQERAYPLRLEKECMQKIRVLSAEGRRSINMQLCMAVETYLKDYEAKYGPIAISKE